MSDARFSTLNLPPTLLSNLSSLGYNKMTPIQAQSLPLILEGQDVIGQARTGSGKTAAFGLGLLSKLNVRQFRVQALVLCPTRELAQQVADEIRRLARTIHNIKVLTLCGGTPLGPQIGSLEHGAHIIVGTPGRVEDHLRKGTLSLSALTSLILDEADRMLDMGFQPTINDILRHVPTRRQTLLFSATFPQEIDRLVARVLHNPVHVVVDSEVLDSQIEQRFYQVADSTKRSEALRLLLLYFSPVSTLVFCNTKQRTEEVADELRTNGFYAQVINGDLHQQARDQRLLQFANKSSSVLVATDVAARGLDIESLDMVINYDLARDADVHTHRIGRTGRAGKSGLACSLFRERERGAVTMLEESFGTIPIEPLPPAQLLKASPAKPDMVTLQVDGGKKQKLRAGDILGALTGHNGIDAASVGKINIATHSAFIAVRRDVAQQGVEILGSRKVKGRSFRARRLRG